MVFPRPNGMNEVMATCQTLSNATELHTTCSIRAHGLRPGRLLPGLGSPSFWTGRQSRQTSARRLLPAAYSHPDSPLSPTRRVSTYSRSLHSWQPRIPEEQRV